VIFVSVDVGRSLVKVAYKGEAGDPVFFEVPSLVATSYSSFSNPGNSMVNSYLDQEMYQIEVKDTQGGWNKDFSNFFMFGKQAQKQGGALVSFSEGSQFHKFGVAVILYAVARAVSSGVSRVRGLDFGSGGSISSRVSLSINLTYSNKESVDFYGKALKGKHKVSLAVARKGKIVSEDIGFEVSDLYCFQQGYAAVFNFIGSKDFATVSKGRGLLVDVGRYTVDFSLVDELTLVRGNSVDFGTRHLVERVQAAVASQGVKLEMSEVESSFLDHGKCFSNVAGKRVSPWKVLSEEDFLSSYYGDIRLAFNSFVGEERIDYVVLCGGGSHLIHEHFIKDFKIPILALDYVRANVLGMLKMMTVRE
jgi:hypothetical protein